MEEPTEKRPYEHIMMIIGRKYCLVYNDGSYISSIIQKLDGDDLREAVSEKKKLMLLKDSQRLRVACPTGYDCEKCEALKNYNIRLSN